MNLFAAIPYVNKFKYPEISLHRIGENILKNDCGILSFEL